jgi:hypothetical protein
MIRASCPLMSYLSAVLVPSGYDTMHSAPIGAAVKPVPGAHTPAWVVVSEYVNVTCRE